MVRGDLLNGSDWSESRCRAIVLLKKNKYYPSKKFITRMGRKNRDI
jgi:hypothetical protein